MPNTLRLSWYSLLLLLASIGADEGVFAQSYSWAWAQGINGTDDEEVADLVTDNATGAVYAVGYTKSDGAISASLGTVISNQDAFLVKHSAAGAVVWGFTPSGAGESQATGVALDAAGNIYITGWFKNTIDLHGLSALGAGILISSGGEDWFVASYTPAGLLRWCTKLGGTSDERPVGVAVSSSGVYAFGTVKTNITTAFGSIPASLPNGKLNLVLAKYSLLGVGQSLISGGSGQDELANSVVADDDGVYVACRTKDNDLLWYGPTGLILGSASAADEWDQRVTAFTTSGTHAWTTTVSEWSDAIEQAPSKLAVGCGALYLTGLTHGPATFPGVGSVSSTTHDFFYLGRIERATGQFVWVNKGTSTGPHHTTGGTDLAVGQNGLVHVVGKFKDNLTMGTRSITSTNGKVQPFVASFRPTGTGASLEDLISSNDATANAITADDQGNFILAGSYKANLACAALSLTGPNDLNGFLVKGSIPALAGVDISYWNAPATMCSNAAPLDLSTLVSPYQTGTSSFPVGSSNVVNPLGLMGAVLGSYAQFNTANGYVTADLGVTVPVGGIISLLWNANGSGATATTLVGTANPPTVAQSSFTTSSTTDVYTSIVLTAPARYIRITRSATSPSFDVDGVYYEYGNDLGGTWSGTGVTGSTFDPTGLSGPVSITYTVGTPPCTTASSNSINVEAAPVGGSITSSVGGMLCPGNNSGTLTLAGYTGSITAWLMSTDGFATSTAIANTTAALTFSNLLVTTQYRVRVGVTGCGIALSGIYTVQVGDNTAPVITTCPPAQTIYVGATCQVALPNLLPGAAGTDNCSTALTWSQFPASGALLNRGIHVVTVTATDASGNATTCNVTITAADTTAPVITGCPSNVSLNADPGACSAIYNFAPPAATDNCGAVISAISALAIEDVDGNVIPALLAPNEYPVGVTTRTFTFSDASGNISSCSFTITVVDTQFPTVVSCPGDITVPADAGACGANVTYTLPTFNDNCLFRVDLTEGLASGAFFPVGTTQVKYLATDSSNNSVNCVFSVIVQDLQNPVITGCPSNISVQAPLAGTGANATWTAPTATDNCGAATVAQTAGQAPGSLFLIGTHTITYTATGPNGGTSTCTFTVTVISNGAPTITCPANQTLYSTQANCAQVFNYATPPVSDDLPLPGGQPVQIDGTGYTSGSAFPQGTTVQTWRVTDSNANSTTCTFNVQVIDTIRPTLQPCPTDITLNADAGACGAIHIYTPPSATDNCDGALTVIRIAGPPSGSLFPIGTTIVLHRATDLSGRLRSCAFTVTVVDNIIPTLANCPVDMNVDAATNACGAYVTFTSPTASDNCSAALTQTLGPISGSLFPIGDTPVEFTATDPAGQVVTCGFNVHVDDTTPATFTYCPDTISATSTVGLCGAAVTYAAPVATDNCSSLMTLPAGQLSGAFFPVGHTSVTYTATDGTNAPAVCTFVVEVIDNQAPAINGLPGNIDMPNTAGVCEATITWTAPTASDNCSATLTSTYASGDVFPVGTTTVTYTATDGTNSTAQNFLITVTDNDDPTITCPANDTLSISSATCDVVMPVYAATATDNCAVDLIWQTAGPVAGDVLTLIGSPYSATWFARDTTGNNSSCVQSIVVIDLDAPLVICPLYDNIEYYLDANCQLAFPDLRDSVTVTDCSAWTNTMWPPADTVFTQEMVVPMTMDIEDVFGNHVDNDHLIWIRDTIAPTFTCNLSTSYSSDAGLCGTNVALPFGLEVDTLISDNCGASTTWSQIAGPSSGWFPADTMWITYQAIDAAGNSATCTFSVIVSDSEAPVFTCPGTTTVNTLPGSCSGLLGDVTSLISITGDNCTSNANLVVSQSPLAGSTVSNGDVVTVTVRDEWGNANTCNMTVVVIDNVTPTITCPANVSGNTNTGCTATGVALGTPVNADNCGVASVTNNAPAAFPIGTTTVTWTVTDNAGLNATCAQTVTVSDNVLPTITCPANFTASMNSACGASGLILGTPVTSDNCGVASVTNNTLGTFPLGTTTVTWIVTDINGLSSTCPQAVTVVDDTAPVITCPLNVTVGAGASCSAVLNDYRTSASVSDNCTAAAAIIKTQSPAPGSILGAGPNTITLTATDAAGNSSNCTFVVLVTDQTAPTITCPSNTSVNTDAGICGAVVNYVTPVGTDNCSGAVTTRTSGLASGSTFPIGTTTVTHTVTDATGLTASCSFTITVVDDQAPSITCPAVIAQLNVGANCTVALPNYITSATISDNCPGVVVVQSPVAGTQVGSGNQSVTITASNNGLSSSCNFTVPVLDNTAPGIVGCPSNITVNAASGACAAQVTWNPPTLANTCAGSTLLQTSGQASGSSFPVGQSIIVYAASDVGGNIATCSFIVEVKDVTAPIITCGADIAMEATAGLCGAVVTYSLPTATDNCSGITITRPNGPASGSVFPVGTTLVKHRATDSAVPGNFSECSFWVTVFDAAAPVFSGCVNIAANSSSSSCAAIVTYPTPTVVEPCSCVVAGSPLGYTALGTYQGRAYYYRTTTSTWLAANNASIAAGGHLAVIRDAAHNTWLRSAVDAAGGTNQSFWIGFNDVATESTWHWTNSTSLSYTNWDSGIGEPNSLGGNEDYGHVKANGKWNDEKNTTFLRSVIEVEATCTTPVLMSGGGTASGSSFQVGTTTVSYQSTDAAGNSSTCNFNVVVTDATAPSFGPTPSILGYVPSNACTITAPNYPTPTDNCPGVTVQHVSGPNPGDALAPGSYQMKYRALDAAGLFSAEQTLNVTVQDTIKPTITSCPSGVNVGTTVGLCTGVASWNAPSVSDNCTGSTIMQTAGPVSGSAFPTGTTTITYTATDAYANTATCSFNVNVVDSEPATITCPSDTTIDQQPGQCTGNYPYAVPEINDNCGGPWGALFVGGLSPGDFPVGTTTNTYTGSVGGTTLTCEFDVTVLDVEAPSITCPANIVVNASPSVCSALVAFNATALDNCIASPTITYSQNPGTLFNIGATTVMVTASDGVNVSAPCTLNVTVNAAVVDLNYSVNSICQNAAPILPSTIIPAINTGGVFSDANQTGTINAITGAFNPAVATPGLHTLGYVFAGACTSHDWFTINVLPSTTNTTIASSCDSYVWAVNGQSYSASGTYSEVSGCNTAVLVLSITGIDDNDACTIDACVNGVAVHTPVDVDDNDACTIDACVNGVAVHTPVDVDDNDACTIDACVNGVAVHTPVDVDDNDACTIDACVNGVAVHTPVDVDDNDACTIDACVNGVAVHTPVDVDDNDACTLDACVNGVAVHTPINVDDNDACTLDACVNGVAVHTPVDVDDNDACTIDACVNGVAVHTPVDVDDNDACTVDACVNGVAVHTPVDVDDNDACTIDACVNGVAVHTPVDVDDNDACTLDACVNGVAVHTPVDVDDNDACTIDACVNGVAVHTPVDVDDNDACTIDACVNGVAVHTPVDVDDNDACTIDACVNGVAVHTPVDVDDNDACTIDACVNGVAVHTPVDVDDNDACTIDACVNGVAVHTPVDVYDNDACTIDACVNGVAVHTPVDVDDNDACTIDACVNGVAVHTPVDVDDNDACTIDACVNGVAVHTPINVDDNDACTLDACVNGVAVHTPVDVDDNDACTIDACVNGVAVHTPVDVDDNDACTIDACVNGVAVHTPINVDDNDACTIDACVNGVAVHTPINVDDNDACTIDACVNGVAVHTPVDVDDNDACTIDACVNGVAVHTPVDVDDNDACTIDACVNGVAVHTPINVDDNDACTLDACVNGVAVHTPVDVDDNDACTIDACVNGVAVHTPVDVDDNDACTIDACVNGVAVHTPINVDDNDACTLDACVNGVPVHTPVDVDDNDACTLDACVNGVAVHTPINVDDNDACTIDSCVNGVAVHTPLDVDDNDACTIDACVNGVAVHTPVDVDDNDACTIDACVNGVAVHTPVDVDDNDACTIDACVNGVAVHTPVDVDDNDACTIDACVNGVAVHTPVDVDDNDACTIDACVNGVAVHTPINVDDNDACTLDACVNGVAVHTPVDVDDNDACTIDACVNGVAVHTPVDVDDNDACTIDACVNGVAVHTPINVDDNDACTIDACVNGVAVHTPINVDDNDACTIDACVNGVAVHTPVDVDDNDACTIDACVNGVAVHTPVDVDDNDACTIDACVNGVAVHTPINVDDNDACTLDACVNGVAVHTPVDVDDNDACTIDACVNGVAVHTPVDVDDNDACTIDACVNGVAVHTPINVDDNDACTLDACVNGVPVHTPVDVDDNDACTLDACVNGVAVHTPINVDDNDACTIDSCVNGVAVHTPLDVDDNDACTIDACVNGVAVHTPVDVDDNDACTIDACVNGVAVHTPVDVDDNDACTLDACVNGVAVHTPVDVDDNDACTLDACVNGVAVHTPVDVDDNDACTIDACVNGVAVHTPINVDDNDACTIDACVNGVAVHTPVDVDDNDACTVDACVNGVAVHTPVDVDDNDACTIDACVNGVAVHTPVDVDDNDACTIDACVNGVAVHTPVDVDDNDACTLDACVNGVAVHTPVDVDDNDACTLDACVNGVAVHTPVDVDDNDACTIDACVNGVAVHTPINVDDNDACTLDACVNGVAVHTPVDVDDNDACTIDACVNGVAVHTPVDVDDNDACTIDACVNGVAVHTPINVDDNDACTLDACVNGVPVHTPVDVDDNDACTLDACVNGVAVHTPINVDDNDACTIDSCVNGVAVHTPLDVDDNDACTIDACVNGVAVHTPVDVDDNDACTIDACVNGVAVHTPVDVDDNDACTIDACVNGVAVHTPVDVDDNDACTLDACVNGVAVHTPVDVDDNDACTLDACVNGVAVHTPVDVDDNDACTIDACVNGVAVHTPINVDDNDACTLDACVNGVAVHTPVDVDDNDACTIDACVNGVAVHTPVDVDDNDACTLDACVNGVAVHTPVDVDDNDACTIDACVNGVAVHTPINVDDNDACTLDACVNGVAVHTPVDVDDNDACTIDACVNGVAVHTPVDVDDNDACTLDACVNGVAVHTPVDVDDNDACTIDACVNGVAVHTPVDVDDNDACTIDACVNGVAVHTPVDVDDNDACTIDACVNGVVVHTPVDVDDNDACTIDSCVNGVAVHTFQDTDNDGVCDATDICPGFDDNVDTDSDGIPDGCDDICSAPIISEFTATAPLCQGGSAQLEATVTGTAPFYFTWSGPGFNQSGTTNSLTVEGASTGTYQVIVTNACGDDTATVNMLVTPFPIATWNPPAILCSGNGTMNLDSLVTGTTGGTWSGVGVIGASFDPSSIQGTTVITYTVGTGVCSATEAHSIVVNQSPIAFAGDDDEVCALSYALQAVISTVPGTWSAPVVGVFTDASSASSTVTVIDNGSYPFVWTVGDGQCFSSDTVIISFHDPGTPLWVDAGEDQDIDVFTSTQLDGAAASGLNVLWSVVSGNGIFSNANDTSTQVVDLAVGENVFVLSATFGQGCAQSTDTVLITVNDIFIPQGFSPNGDGVNDSFRITGINAFPGNDLKVFNRWGQEVVGQSGYANDWKGSGSNGQDLPDDTYFYVLNLTPERTYNGFVVIKR